VGVGVMTVVGFLGREVFTVLEEQVAPSKNAESGGMVFVNGVVEKLIDSPVLAVLGLELLVLFEGFHRNTFRSVSVKGRHFHNLFSKMK